MYGKRLPVSALNGKRVVKVVGCEVGSEEIVFTCDDGSVFRMWHEQDCCENVRLVDVVGDAGDLLGLIVDAWEVTEEASAAVIGDDSGTWTFYNIQSSLGCVTLRWLGESNGYYSERVSFCCETTNC